MNTNRNDRPARAGRTIALVVAMLLICTAGGARADSGRSVFESIAISLELIVSRIHDLESASEAQQKEIDAIEKQAALDATLYREAIDALEKRVAALEALTSQTLTNHAREVKRVAPPQLIDGEEGP